MVGRLSQSRSQSCTVGHMSPARTGRDRGCYEIDRTYKNVGRVRQSSGTTSVREYRNRLALLDKLAKAERWDVLRALQTRQVSIESLIEADRDERLGATLTDLLTRERLFDREVKDLNGQTSIELGALNATLLKMGKGATRSRYADSFSRFVRIVADILPETATVNDLLTVPWDTIADPAGRPGVSICPCRQQPARGDNSRRRPASGLWPSWLSFRQAW